MPVRGGGIGSAVGDHGMESMARPLLYSSLVAGLLTGCQSFSSRCDDCLPPKTGCCKYSPKADNLVNKLTAYDCAGDALKALEKSCGKVSSDFEAGFHQAYEDLAMGRLAMVPPVPASKYWNAHYRSCAGEQAVADWFEGYRAGLQIGQQGGVSRFNRVKTSWGSGGDWQATAWTATGGGCGTGQCGTERSGAERYDGGSLAPANYAAAGPYSMQGRYGAVVPVGHTEGTAGR